MHRTTKMLGSPADAVALVTASGSKVCDCCAQTFAVASRVTPVRQYTQFQLHKSITAMLYIVNSTAKTDVIIDNGCNVTAVLCLKFSKFV